MNLNNDELGSSSIINQLPVAYIELEANYYGDGTLRTFTIKRVNEEFERISRFSKNRLVGKNLVELAKSLKIEELRSNERLKEAFESKRSVEFKKYFTFIDKHLKIKAAPIKSNRLAVYLIDISDEIKTVEAAELVLQNANKEPDYQSMTESVLEISGAKFAAFNAYSGEGKEFRTVAIAGLNKQLKAASSFLGMDLLGTQWEYDPVREERIKNNVISEFDSLAELTRDVLPKALIKNFQRILGLGKCYIVRISSEKEHIGDFTLMMKAGTSLNNNSLVEIYSRIAGISINAYRVEKENNKQSDLLHELTERVPGILFQFKMTAEGKVSLPYASRGLRELFELKPEDVETDASKIFSRIHEADLNAFHASIQYSFKSLKMWKQEFRVRLPKKGELWLKGKAKPQGLKDGSVIWHGYVSDITTQVIDRLALEESRERFKLAVKGSRDGIWDWDLIENSLYLSPRWKEMLGYKDIEIENSYESFKSLIHPADKERVLENAQSYLKGELPEYDIEFRMLHKDGSSRWIKASGEAFRDKSGTPYRMAGSHSDITELKNVEMKLREQNEEYAALNEEYQSANEELKDTNERLIQSEKKYGSIIETASDGFWLVGEEGQFLEVNKCACDMSGYSKEEMLTMKIKDLEAVEDEEDIKERMEFLMTNGYVKFESKHRRKNGKLIDVEISTSIIPGTKKPCFAAFVRDITKRKKQEKALKIQNEEYAALNEEYLSSNEELRDTNKKLIESERGYRELVDNMKEGLWTTHNGCFDSVNKAMCRIFGYEEEELLGMEAWGLALPEQQEGLKSAFLELSADTAHVPIEAECLTKKGKRIFVQISVSKITSKRKMQGLVSDVSKSKEAERALRESEKRFRTIVESANDSYWLTGIDGNVIDVNDSACKMLGYTKAELTEMYIYDFDYEVDKEGIREIGDSVIENGGAKFESRHKRKDGKIIDVEISVRHIKIDGEDFFASFVRDVTEKKAQEQQLKMQNEEYSALNEEYLSVIQELKRNNKNLHETKSKLAENENRFRSLFESANDAIFLAEYESGKVVNANKKALELTGYRKNELIGMHQSELHPPDLDEYSKDSFKEIPHSTEKYQFSQSYIQRKNGERVPVEISTSVVYQDGKTYIYGIFRDVSERKKAEDELRTQSEEIAALNEEYMTVNEQLSEANKDLKQSEERFFLAVRGSQDGIWDWDLENGELYLSPHWKEMLGYEDDELENEYKTFEELLHPEDKDFVLNEYNEYLQKKSENYSAEFRMRHKDGHYIWILARGKALFDSEGKAYRMAGSHTDITSRIEQQHALEESEKRFKDLILSSNDIIWEVDIEGHYTFISEKVRDVLGYEPQELVGKAPFEIMREDEAEKIEGRFLEMIENGGKIIDWENWNVHKDGSEVCLLTNAVPIKNRVGSIIGYRGVDKNITQRKKTERALEESEKRFRYALAGANEGLWDWNIKTGDVFFSDRWCEMLGYSPDEIRHDSSTWRMLIHPDDYYECIIKREEHAQGDSEFYEHTQRILTKSGKWKWIEDRGKIVEWDEKGQPTRMVGTHIDVHTKHELEDRIHKELDIKKHNIARAQELQKHLNTQSLPEIPGVRVSAFYMPSEELGGDFFNIVRSEDNTKLIIILGDCTGHGIEASMDATLLKAICDRHIHVLQLSNRTDRFLESVNQDMFEYSIEEKYPTLLAFIIDMKQKKIFFSNANAPLPIMIKDGQAIEFEKAQGFHIGFEYDTKYELKSYDFENTKLLFYSDSLYEFKDKHGNETNIKQIKKLLPDIEGSENQFLQNIVNMISDISGTLKMDDDLTLIELETKEDHFEHKEFHRLDELEYYRADLLKMMIKYGFSIEEAEETSLILHELGKNGITYGNGLDESKTLFVDVKLQCNYVEIAIEDEGDGFDYQNACELLQFEDLISLIDNNDIDRFTHGRGVWLSHLYMDNVEYNEKGNKVRIKKYVKEKDALFSL